MTAPENVLSKCSLKVWVRELGQTMFGQPTVSSSECTTHWRLNSIKHTHTVVTTIICSNTSNTTNPACCQISDDIGFTFTFTFTPSLVGAKFSRFFLHHSQRSGLLLRSCTPSPYSATFNRAVIQLGRFEIIAQQRSPRAQNVFIFYFHFRRHRHLLYFSFNTGASHDQLNLILPSFSLL